jgi:hypothetical protein
MANVQQPSVIPTPMTLEHWLQKVLAEVTDLSQRVDAPNQGRAAVLELEVTTVTAAFNRGKEFGRLELAAAVS